MSNGIYSADNANSLYVRWGEQNASKKEVVWVRSDLPQGGGDMSPKGNGNWEGKTGRNKSAGKILCAAAKSESLRTQAT